MGESPRVRDIGELERDPRGEGVALPPPPPPVGEPEPPLEGEGDLVLAALGGGWAVVEVPEDGMDVAVAVFDEAFGSRGGDLDVCWGGDFPSPPDPAPPEDPVVASGTWDNRVEVKVHKRKGLGFRVYSVLSLLEGGGTWTESGAAPLLLLSLDILRWTLPEGVRAGCCTVEGAPEIETEVGGAWDEGEGADDGVGRVAAVDLIATAAVKGGGATERFGGIAPLGTSTLAPAEEEVVAEGAEVGGAEVGKVSNSKDSCIEIGIPVDPGGSGIAPRVIGAPEPPLIAVPPWESPALPSIAALPKILGSDEAVGGGIGSIFLASAPPPPPPAPLVLREAEPSASADTAAGADPDPGTDPDLSPDALVLLEADPDPGTDPDLSPDALVLLETAEGIGAAGGGICWEAAGWVLYRSSKLSVEDRASDGTETEADGGREGALCWGETRGFCCKRLALSDAVAVRTGGGGAPTRPSEARALYWALAPPPPAPPLPPDPSVDSMDTMRR